MIFRISFRGDFQVLDVLQKLSMIYLGTTINTSSSHPPTVEVAVLTPEQPWSWKAKNFDRKEKRQEGKKMREWLANDTPISGGFP